MIDTLRELGYRVGWSQGATPEDLRQQQREAGWAWEGDTHVEHHVHVPFVDGEPVTGKVPIQHFDAEAAGYVPEHLVLRDDSHEPTIWWVEGPVKGGDFGEPSGYTQLPSEDGEDPVEIPLVVQLYVRYDDEDLLSALVDGHADVVAELEQRERETPEQTFERHAEAEERAAEES